MLENIGKIIEVNKSNILIETNYKDNLLNHYLKINNNIIVEVINRKDNILITKLLGEITNNSFSYGVLVLPNLDSTVSIPNEVDLKVILANVNYFEDKDLILGKNPVYNKEVTININSFFQNHFAIFGSTGSGKSCGVARIIQNLYSKSKKVAYNSNLFIFDTFGEYTPVLKNISNLNPYLSFKHYTTDPSEINNNILSIPPWLLGIDELAILLNATNPSQLLILEKSLKYVNIFKRDDDNSNKYKNDVLARCIIDILLSGKPSIQIRDQVFSILSFFKTNDLSLETIIPSPGYNRALKHCLLIDKDGKMQEMQLLIDFFSKYLIDKVELTLPTNLKYDLNDLEDAFEFALIDEGVFKSEKVYDELNILKVRLHSLNNSNDSMFFKYDQFVTRENYIINLIKNSTNNNKCQIIHFNISYVNDRLAKTIVKIISKMLFDYSKFKSSRTSVPFHIILEEAHRYVQNDNDVNLLGYNIFERIAKEGRKYGVLLGLISQRPDEISTTVVSQCNNFLIFKMNHPKDLEYIKQLVPNITDDEINDLRILKPGSCIGFGTSFKFPSIVKLDLPSPTPLSNNVDISKEWFITIN